MKIIKDVRINRYRSILNTTRGNVTRIPVNHMNVIVGSNDTGKSNFLRALNLFFNHKDMEYMDFWKEYSIQRHGVQREPNEFEIELTIEPPKKQYFNHGGDIRWIKKWIPGNSQPIESIAYASGAKFIEDKRSMVAKWLKRIEFVYVPAIKSQEYFDDLILSLYDILDEDTALLEGSFNEQIKDQTELISREISRRLKIDSILQFKGSFRELFSKLEFGSENGKIMMSQRGDGIKVRHIPIVLQSIAEAKLIRRKPRDPRTNTIWGFEEPENHLEFASAKRLAENFIEYVERINFKEELQSNFDEGIQVFISTHSPVFYTLTKEYSEITDTLFASKRADESTDIKPVPKDERSRVDLEQKMGLDPLIELSGTWANLNTKMLQLDFSLSEINSRLQEVTKPVVLTEGKTDAIILNCAWGKLFGDAEMPFDIMAGDTSDPADKTIVNSSASTLEHFFKANRSSDSLKIVLWDYDKEGIDAFRRCKNHPLFRELEYVKRHNNGRSFGVLLPPHDDLSSFVEAHNLPIEFYFNSEDYLKRDQNGHGIWLEGYKTTKTFGKITKSYQESDPWLSYVRGDKNSFAQNVVPTFERPSFIRFEKLFDLLTELVGLTE